MRLWAYVYLLHLANAPGVAAPSGGVGSLGVPALLWEPHVLLCPEPLLKTRGDSPPCCFLEVVCLGVNSLKPQESQEAFQRYKCCFSEGASSPLELAEPLVQCLSKVQQQLKLLCS